MSRQTLCLIMTAFLAIVFVLPVKAQDEALRQQLAGKSTFREITETFDQYLNSIPESPDKTTLAKHYSRWAFYQSLHLGADGNFVNIARKTLEVAQQQSDAPLTSANGSWTFVGPNSSTNNNPLANLNGLGRVDRIVFHPSNSSIIYVGTPAGGLWKTTNGGLSWTALSSFIPSLGISGIVIDWNNPNNIYVLTGDGDSFVSNYFVYLSGYQRSSVGVLVSHDGGTTWETTGQMSNFEFDGYKLIQHPTNPAILLAATSDGLFRTSNSGQTWVRVHNGKHFDVEFKPGTPTKVYASGPGSFYNSNDTGDSWLENSTFDFGMCANQRVEIGVTPNSVSRVFLVCGPASGGTNTFCGFYRSTTSGSSFLRVSNSPNILGNDTGGGSDQSIYDMTMAVKPTDYQTIVVGGLVTYRSTDAGSTFSNLTDYWQSGTNYIHPDVHCVAFNPLNNYLYAATDGGFYRSTNDGDSWSDLSAGINVTQFYYIDDINSNPNAILGGAQDNGIKIRIANTVNFDHLQSGDGADVVFQYNDQTRGYCALNTMVLRYTNFWDTVQNIYTSGNYFKKVEMNSSNPSLVYIGDNRVYKYNAVTGGGATQLGFVARGAWALKTCPSNSNVIYAAGGTNFYDINGQLFRSADAGSTWDTISDQTGFPANFPRISDIGVHPNNSNFAYAAFSGYTNGVKVLYTSTGGQDWYNVSYDLPNIPVWSIEVDAGNNLYVGTDYGVYYKEAGAIHWEPFYNGLPNVPVSDLAINETSDQLLAATFGRGIWKSTLRTTCPASVAIITNVSGQYFKSASSSITMSSQLTGGTGTSAVLRSGGAIDLLPGFLANSDPGNKFLAYLGACGSGMPPAFTTAGTMTVPELAEFETTHDRSRGTLEVTPGPPRELILRLFENGFVKIIMTDAHGAFLKEILSAEKQKGEFSISLNSSDLAKGLYYFHLVINNQVTHLQEFQAE